jgi:prolyl-tRNA synthetase
MVNVLAMPVLVGRKTVKERFAGAINSMTCEAMMRDGKALQMGTSHELGQNFARVFDITYSDPSGAQQLCWTTSWGVSTRMMGGLIMSHGDDRGLVLPPRIAPTQVVVLVVRDGDGTVEAARRLTEELVDRGVRAELDDRVDVAFGRRATDWELRGVPVRLELGPRDLVEGNVTLVRRDIGTKSPQPLATTAEAMADLLEAVQADLLRTATERRDAAVTEVDALDKVAEAAQTGFARVPWSVVGVEGEAALAASAVTVRCLRRPDGSVPRSEDEPDLVAYCARSY